MGNSWLRLYNEMPNDPKIKLLAFEDRWHYVSILTFKNSGELDSDVSEELKCRMLAAHLGLSLSEMDSLKKRLSDVMLIDENWQPLGWEKRQFTSDSGAERAKRYRENKKKKQSQPVEIKKEVTGVTLPSRYSDVPEAEAETETEEAYSSSEPKDSSERPAQIQYEKIKAAWNNLGLSQLSILTDKRKVAIKARTREMGMVKQDMKNMKPHEAWESLVDFISQSDFLMGKKSDFVVSFDWLIKPSNFIKVVEGNYHG